MKIFVTGVTGFIGQYLVDKLIDNYEICALVREGGKVDDVSTDVKIFTYNNKISELIEFFKQERFDGVIHLASLFLASHTPEDISSLIHSNINLGTDLLEASSVSGVRWFINTGTFWQHYENEEYNPVNLYAATKKAFEDIAKFYTQTNDLVFTTIKLNDTFGPHDTRAKVFNLWTKIAASGETLAMSAGEQIIDISYIDDVISAYERLIELLAENANEHKDKTYVVSNKERLSLKELSKIFEKATHSTLNIDWGGREYRDREVMLPYNQGTTVPGWKQKYTLEEAIRKTVKEI